MFIPRVGQEVVVEFLEGNPDRPLVTGVVYNATMKVPYDLPDNKTISTIKSNSSTGGGGYNELKFDDAKGSEKVYFQAQKDYEKKVLNDEKATVHGKSETTVETGDCTVTVSAGNHTLDISAGSSTVTAAQSITLKVGSSSLKIDPTGVTISAAKISIEATATMSLQGGTAMTVKAGMISLN
jgi:type VI secretion system secreted protein VgrG